MFRLVSFLLLACLYSTALAARTWNFVPTPIANFTDTNSLQVTNAIGNGAKSANGVGASAITIPFSTCAWAKATGASSNMWGNSDNTNGGGYLMYNDSGAGLQPDFEFTDAATPIHYFGVSTTAVYSQNAWHHVCGVYTAATQTTVIPRAPYLIRHRVRIT